jgi:hypothetical protein
VKNNPHRKFLNPPNPNGTDIRKKCFQKPPEGDINKNKTITTTTGG